MPSTVNAPCILAVFRVGTVKSPAIARSPVVALSVSLSVAISKSPPRVVLPVPTLNVLAPVILVAPFKVVEPSTVKLFFNVAAPSTFKVLFKSDGALTCKFPLEVIPPEVVISPFKERSSATTIVSSLIVVLITNSLLIVFAFNSPNTTKSL